MWLSFEAQDVLFFRDGRPFDAGDAHAARSIFPPLPGTLLGATRALLLEEVFGGPQPDGASVAGYLRWLRDLPRDITNARQTGSPPRYLAALEELGVSEDPGSQLQLRGPFVVGPDDKVLVAAPRDVMERPDARLVALSPLAGETDVAEPIAGVQWSAGPPIATAGGATPPPSLPLVTDAVDLEELKGAGWIDSDGLTAYLAGSDSIPKRDPPFLSEPRAGIARNERGTAQEHHFYEATFVRPQTATGRARLLARLTPDLIGQEWRMPLGGEGKIAHVLRADASAPALALADLLDPQSQTVTRSRANASKTGWIRLALLQPAIFRAGWLPDAVETNGELRLGDHTFHLRSAAVGKPVAVSGWDLRWGEAKPLRRAVPAGSVYIFQIVAKDAGGRQEAADAFWNQFHGTTALVDPVEPWGRAGYGLTVAGVCTPIVR